MSEASCRPPQFGLLERDLKASRFSVLVFSTLIVYFVWVPLELKDFGKTLLASTAFSSNILFYR